MAAAAQEPKAEYHPFRFRPDGEVWSELRLPIPRPHLRNQSLSAMAAAAKAEYHPFRFRPDGEVWSELRLPIPPPHLRNRFPSAMAAAAQEPKAEYHPFRFRPDGEVWSELRLPMPCPFESCNGCEACPHVPPLSSLQSLLGRFVDNMTDDQLLMALPTLIRQLGNPSCCRRFVEDLLSMDSPGPESIQNFKGNGSLRPSVIDNYTGTQDPNGTGTGLAIVFADGGAYHVVNDHALNRNYWPRAPVNGGSPGPKMWLLAAIRNLKKHIEDLPAAAAAAFTKERVEIGLPPSLAGFKLSALARVSEAANPGGATEVAANPGGATEVFLLDSGASFHAVGDDRILQGIWNFPFDMWATLPDNSPLRIIGIGTIEMNEFSIPNVFLVDRLRNNLISVSQLDIDHAMCSCFHGRQCTVMRRDGTVVGGAMLEGDGLYHLSFLQV